LSEADKGHGSPAGPSLRDWWIDQVLSHHYLVLLLGLVLTVAAGWRASMLHIDSDLRALLPQDHPVVTNLDRIEETFGALGSVNVVVKGGNPEARHAFADAVAAELEEHPSLDQVEYRLQTSFFLDHALYYLSDPEFVDLEERVGAWQHYEMCTAAPTVCTDDPDPKAREKLTSFIDQKREEARERTGFEDYFEREGIDALVVFLHPTEPSSDLQFAIAVSHDMQEIVSDVHARDGPWRASGVEFNLVGPYIQLAAEREIISEDALRAAIFGLTGVLFVLYVLFRSFRAVLLLIVPLLCGVIWSLGATQLMLGHLNTMTSLISSVVMGMGIDAGIHLLTRARREREWYDDTESIRQAFRGLIVPLLVASSTTVGALAIMATSDFLAFKEFGIIAATGVGLCLLSMVTIFPSMGRLVGIKKAKGRKKISVVGLPTRWLLARPGLLFVLLGLVTVVSVRGVNRVRADGFENNGRILQSDRMRAQTEADVFLIGDIFGKDIHAGTLTLPTYAETQRVFDVATEIHAERVRKGETVVADLFAAPELMPDPGIVMDARRAQIEELTEDFTDRTWAKLEGRDPDAPPEAGEDGGDDEFDGFDEFDDEGGDAETGETGDTGADETGGDDGIDGGTTGGPEPAQSDEGADEPQATTGEAVGGEDGGEADAGPKEDDGLSKEDAAQLRRMIEAKPFGVDDLPPTVLSRVRASDGSYGVFAYPNFDPADIFKGIEFLEETDEYTGGGDDRVYVGETSVYAAMYDMMNKEWPQILGMATLLVLGLVFWQVRSIGDTLLTLVPLVVALWWLLAVMGFFTLRFTLFNVPILPAVLGIGVDNGVYLTAGIRGRRGQSGGLARSVDETGRAILAATATTMVGFASFMVADSGGLRSIGVVAVLGILMAMLAAMLVLPTLSALAERRRGIAIIDDTAHTGPHRLIPTPLLGDAEPAAEPGEEEEEPDRDQPSVE
jgi:predicted RND superfamily exporter protein